MHSGTKYLDGQGRVMAGALCASQDLVTQSFLPVLKSAGMTLAPFNAWVVLKGLETLDIRMQAQSARALALAQWLQVPIRPWRGCITPGLSEPPAAHAGHGAAVGLWWCGVVV
jgi:cystathionine beta-lyase/cystathionine gamma-synthase